MAQLATLDGVFRIIPPITVIEEQLDLAPAIIEEALRTTPGTMPLYAEEDTSTQSAAIIEANL